MSYLKVLLPKRKMKYKNRLEMWQVAETHFKFESNWIAANLRDLTFLVIVQLDLPNDS